MTTSTMPRSAAESQGECVVEAQALERVAAEEAANKRSDASGEPDPIVGHGH